MYSERRFFQKGGFDPDENPWIDVDRERSDPRRTILKRETATREAEARMRELYLSHKKTIDRNMGLAYPFDHRMYAAEGYAAAILLPIRVETETIESIQPTLESILATCHQLPRPTLVLAWLNYQLPDERRDQKAIALMQSRSKVMGEYIKSVLEVDDNDDKAVDASFAIEQLPPGATIPQIRNNMGLTIAGWCRAEDARSRSFIGLPMAHDFPFVWWDADMVLGENALPIATDALARDSAIFVYGNLEYTGGVMKKPIAEVAHEETNSKLLYLTETMRRKMFHHLPPTVPRGYLPENGLAMKLGPFMTLGMCNSYAKDNETYWLEVAAREALRPWYDVSTYRPVPRTHGEPNMPPYPAPYISNHIANKITSPVRYEPYMVRSSIRGVEARIRRYGRHALIGFDQDQGDTPYRLWSHEVLERPDPIKEQELSLVETMPLLNAIYSYFRDCGGQLFGEDLHELNDLMIRFFKPDAKDLIVWLPSYVSKEKRPKVGETRVA